MSGRPLDFVYVLWFDHAKGEREWEKTQYHLLPGILTRTRTAIHIIRVSAGCEYYYYKKDYVICDPPIALSEKEIMWLLLKVGA